VFLFCSTAGLICKACTTKPALSRFSNELMDFHSFIFTLFDMLYIRIRSRRSRRTTSEYAVYVTEHAPATLGCAVSYQVVLSHCLDEIVMGRISSLVSWSYRFTTTRTRQYVDIDPAAGFASSLLATDVLSSIEHAVTVQCTMYVHRHGGAPSQNYEWAIAAKNWKTRVA